MQDEQEEIVKYGREMLKTLIFGFVIMVIVAEIMGVVVEGIIFFVMLMPLRQYSGGLHMRTKIQCLLTSIIIFVVAMVFCKQTIPVYLQFLMLIIFNAIVIMIAPVDNIKNRLHVKEKEKYGRIARCISISYFLLYIILYAWGLDKFAYIIVCVMGTDVLLLIAGEIKNEILHWNL